VQQLLLLLVWRRQELVCWPLWQVCWLGLGWRRQGLACWPLQLVCWLGLG
jgi:hypothetical protein